MEVKKPASFQFPTPQDLLAEKYRDFFSLSGYASGHSNPYLTDRVIQASGTVVPTYGVLGRNVEAGKVAITFTSVKVPGAKKLRYNDMMTTYQISLASILRPWNIKKAPRGKVIIVPVRLVTDDPDAGIYMELNIGARDVVDSPRDTQAKKEAKIDAKAARALVAEAKRAMKKEAAAAKANKAADGETTAQAKK